MAEQLERSLLSAPREAPKSYLTNWPRPARRPKWWMFARPSPCPLASLAEGSGTRPLEGAAWAISARKAVEDGALLPHHHPSVDSPAPSAKRFSGLDLRRWRRAFFFTTIERPFLEGDRLLDESTGRQAHGRCHAVPSNVPVAGDHPTGTSGPGSDAGHLQAGQCRQPDTRGGAGRTAGRSGP